MRLRTSPYGGTDRFKFIGYDLSPQQQAPLLCLRKFTHNLQTPNRRYHYFTFFKLTNGCMLW